MNKINPDNNSTCKNNPDEEPLEPMTNNEIYTQLQDLRVELYELKLELNPEFNRSPNSILTDKEIKENMIYYDQKKYTKYANYNHVYNFPRLNKKGFLTKEQSNLIYKSMKLRENQNKISVIKSIDFNGFNYVGIKPKRSTLKTPKTTREIKIFNNMMKRGNN